MTFVQKKCAKNVDEINGWFVRFGGDKKRTLLHIIFSMICWLFIAFFIFVQVPETIRYIYSPFCQALLSPSHSFLLDTLWSAWSY